MLFCENFKFDYGEVLKALGAAAPAPAPAAPAPAAAAAPPMGAEQRKRGGSYVRRWWDNGKWQYEYPGEGSVSGAHGPGHFGDAQDKTRSHVMEVHPTTPTGASPEQAYHHALGQALQHGSRHEAPHPHPEKAAAGEKISLEVLPPIRSAQKHRLRVLDANGQPLFDPAKNRERDPFDTHGQYEKWYRQVQSGQQHYDHLGRPLAFMVPNVGEVDRATGQLNPPVESARSAERAWVVHVSKDNPAFAKIPESERGDKRFKSPEAALAKIRSLQRNVQLRGAEDQPTEAAPAAMPEAARMTAMQPPAAPTAAPTAAAPDQSRLLSAQEIMQDPIVSKLRWRALDTLGRRNIELDLSPEEEQRAVGEVAKEYSGPIINYARYLVSKTPEFFGADQYWMERLTGKRPGEKEFRASPEPGSPLYNAIRESLRKFDPRRGVGLPGWLTGPRGQLLFGLKDEVDKLREEAFRTAAPEVGAPGETVNRLESAGDVPAPKPPEEAPQEPEAPYAGETATDVPDWKTKQAKKLRDAFTAGLMPQNHFESAMRAIQDRVKGEGHIAQFFEAMNGLGYGDHLIDFEKAFGLRILAIYGLAAELQKADANGYITRDKNVMPDHQYSHREGDEDHPRFYFRDQNGNYVRYTNAPTGHGDAANRFGDPAVHPSEPTPDKAPQFFTPDGKKLSRAPTPGANVEWNPSYHSADPKNLWAARWVNPLTGEHEHAYVDADMRMIPKLYIHQQNALTDVRIPILRKYVQTLSKSPMVKDRIVALALALLDQGRFRAQELTMLTPADVEMSGGVVRIGNRFIFADQRVRSMLSLVTQGRTPNEPLFAVPQMKRNGEVDETLIRRIGPHFLSCLLDQIGLSLPSLQTFHATQTFSREVNRLLTENDIPWASALEYATVAVAQEMGHDLSQEPDLEQALPMIRDLLVDPIVLEALEMNAKKLGLLGEAPILLPLPPPAVMYVSFDLVTRTADEEDFSRWLHSYPVHNHVDPPTPERPRTQTLEPRMDNPPNAPSVSTPPGLGAPRQEVAV